MYEVITIGSSLIDSFIKSDKFKLKSGASAQVENLIGQKNVDENSQICLAHGQKTEIDQFILRTGGGGSNTAVGFARMGFRTGIVTELGTDIFSKIILEEFKKEYVSTNLVVSEKNENTGGSIILLGTDGSRTVLVHRGASSLLDPQDIPVEKISRANWVHLSSIAGRFETLEKIFLILKKENKGFSWNPGKKELALIVAGKIKFSEITCELLFVNIEEWELIKYQQNDALNNVKQVIVTNGKKGGKVFVGELVVADFKSGESESVDDTGAGDSFVVGFVAAFLKGKIVSECCEWGKNNAVSVISYIGAKPGLLTLDQVKVHNKNTT